MSDETEQNNQIALFMEISGADFETAKQALTVNNFNLEQAINYHLERGNSIGSPEDDVAAASTSTDANLPIDDEDDVRPPILPKREQLIMPNEDNFRYRKRRTVAVRPVCPLRNFELEGRLQEERLKAAVLVNFTGTIDGPAAIDSSTPPLATQPNSAVNSLHMPTTATNSKHMPTMLGFSGVTARELIHANMVGRVPSAHLAKSTAPSRLSELFRPPVEISFCGSFQAARDYAKDQNKWLIVNVQDMNDFNCQVLNRDIWSSERLRAVIKKYFIFWQVAIDNTDGHRFQVFYGIQVYPYIGVIDPRTGEEKLSYKTGFKLTHDEFMSKLKDYLMENTPHPNTDIVNDAIVELDEKLFETKVTTNSTSTTTTTNNHVTSSPCAKRKRVEPSSLSEQEQIELAIAHSLKEVCSAEDCSKSEKSEKSDSFEEPSSDDEFDFDDDTSNQSFVKSQTSQSVSEKSMPCENKSATGATAAVSTVTTTTTASTTSALTDDDLNDDDDSKEFDSKSIEPCVSTVETYDKYLGDETDEKARIQLRLPTSDRHIFEWPCTTKLKALKLYIPFKYPELTNDPYKVICPFVGGQSTNNILEMDDTLTLKEANLYPTAILHLRNED